MRDGIPDAYELWEANEAAKEAWLESRPVCDMCGQHIQEDHYYDFGDACVCENCKDEYLENYADSNRVEIE